MALSVVIEGCLDGTTSAPIDVTDACLETGCGEGEFTVPLEIEVCRDGSFAETAAVTDACRDIG